MEEAIVTYSIKILLIAFSEKLTFGVTVYNWCEVKAKMWILNLGKPVNIPVLSQEMAIELGANLLGESVIFVIGAGLLIVEYNRQVFPVLLNKMVSKFA